MVVNILQINMPETFILQILPLYDAVVVGNPACTYRAVMNTRDVQSTGAIEPYNATHALID